MKLETKKYYQALCAKDKRFDGVFFVGVKTTGIYCRPVCRARTPRLDRCVFYSHAIEAEKDGFRACFRCRPELAPGNSSIDSISTLLQKALSQINAGHLQQQSIESFANSLGVTARHLRRVFKNELGVTPLLLAQSRKMALAKQLLQDTSLSISEIAFTSGFASVRRFNALFQERFACTPSSLRRAKEKNTDNIVLRLDYRTPFDWNSLLQFFRKRLIAGVESCENGHYKRSVQIAKTSGWVSVKNDSKQSALKVSVSLSLQKVLLPLLQKLRALFDLDAHPESMSKSLQKDSRLHLLIEKFPGIRIPGSVNGFETAIRAILGQQVRVNAANKLCQRIVQKLGTPIQTPFASVHFLFPNPEDFLNAGVSFFAKLGMPEKRAIALVALSKTVYEENLQLIPHAPYQESKTKLLTLPGIGEWTAEYIAMRVLAWPDAFPASDIVLRKALGGLSEKQAKIIAQQWSPWRSYAAMYLWIHAQEK